MDAAPVQPAAIASITPTLQSVLECPVCLCLICEPITLYCGHSFCRVCLKHSLEKTAKKCPTCREVSHVSAADAKESQTLKSLAMLADPELYKERLAEALEERKAWNSLYPCFFTSELHFPGATLSVHMTEPRYRMLASRVLCSNRSFAYCFGGGPAQPGNVALLAKVKSCEIHSDGSYVLEFELSERLRVVDCYEESGTQGLHYSNMHTLTDEELTGSALNYTASLALDLVKTVGKTLELCQELITRKHGKMPAFVPGSARSMEALSIWVCGFAPLGEAEKAKLLCGTDTTERFRRTLEAFQALKSPPRELTAPREPPLERIRNRLAIPALAGSPGGIRRNTIWF